MNSEKIEVNSTLKCLVAALGIGLFGGQALAMNVLLCNDDSIAAANIRALK